MVHNNTDVTLTELLTSAAWYGQHRWPVSNFQGPQSTWHFLFQEFHLLSGRPSPIAHHEVL